jgi:RNA polymerase subunit RPABC4/transcription elongation factor Spt4
MLRWWNKSRDCAVVGRDESEFLSSELSDQQSHTADANTTAAAGLSRQNESASLLNNDNNDELINNGGSAESVINAVQSYANSSTQFDWFGLLKNNQLKNNGTSSSRRENKKSCCEYKSIDDRIIVKEVVAAGDDDDDDDLGEESTVSTKTNNGHECDSTNHRFNWFGLLQLANISSSSVGDACGVNSLISQQQQQESIEEEEEDEGEEGEVCPDEVCSETSFMRESSAEAGNVKTVLSPERSTKKKI